MVTDLREQTLIFTRRNSVSQIDAEVRLLSSATRHRSSSSGLQFVEAHPEQLSRAANKGTPYVIDFQTTEAQYKSVVAEKPTGSTSNPGQHADCFQPQTLADEIEEERTQQRPRVPKPNGQKLEV